MAVILVVTVSWPAAARADESDYLRVELTSIAPDVLASAGELVISGRVTNISGAPIKDAEVRLWRDATPIADQAGLDQARSGTQPLGATMAADGARAQLTSGGTLADGASIDFTVRASLDPNANESLWLTPPGAVYQVGIQVFGTASTGGYQLLGHSAAFMAYPDRTVSTSTVVVLSNRPTLLPLDATGTQPAAFADDSLLVELTTRLADLMRLAEQPGVATVIDPALFDEVTALASRFRVQQPDGTWRDGTAAESAIASGWLARLQALQRAGSLYRGLYGSPDIMAAVHAGQADVVLGAAGSLPSGHPLAGLPLVVVPTNEEVDTVTLDALQPLGPALVLASNAAPNPGVLHTYNGLRVVSVAAHLTTDGTGNGTATPVQLRGLLFAQQLVAGRQPGGVAVSVVTTSLQAALEGETALWRTRIGFDALTRAGAATSSGLELGSAAAPTPSILGPRMAAVANQVIAWGELCKVDDSQRRLAVMTATAWSGLFGRNEDAQVAWLDRMAAPTTVLQSEAIQVRVSDWVTTSKNDNQLPVTVTNGSGVPITVKVHFESENPLRILVPDSGVVHVDPGESATVRVGPRTSGNGKVAITAQLVTVGGLPVGAPADFVITGTDAGRVAWLIIVGSGVVLLVATTLRIRQVRRERRPA